MNTVATPWPDSTLIVQDPLDPSLMSEYFDEGELDAASRFRLEKRRVEWMLGRIAAKRLGVAMGLTSNPRAIVVDRPFLSIDGRPSDWRVSLSHSGSYAAAAILQEPVGIDIQVVREISRGVTHLFLTSSEADELAACSLPHAILHFWCAKEAEFKRNGETTTLKGTPLRLREAGEDGLRFERVETRAIGDLIVALSR